MPEIIKKVFKTVHIWLVGYDRTKVNGKQDDELIQEIKRYIDDESFREQLEQAME